MAKLKLSSVNWALISSRPFRKQKVNNKQFYSKQIIQVDSPICLVLVTGTLEQANWYKGGYANAYYLTNAMPKRNRIALRSWLLGANRATLLDFSQYQNSTNKYAIEISAVSWLNRAYFELWKYKGDISDGWSEESKTILQRINDISSFNL